MDDIRIRAATVADVPAIVDIADAPIVLTSPA